MKTQYTINDLLILVAKLHRAEDHDNMEAYREIFRELRLIANEMYATGNNDINVLRWSGV